MGAAEPAPTRPLNSPGRDLGEALCPAPDAHGGERRACKRWGTPGRGEVPAPPGGMEPGGRTGRPSAAHAAFASAVSKDPQDPSLNFLSMSDHGDQTLGNASQSTSVTQLCLTPCDPRDCSTPGLPVHHQLLEVTQNHVHYVGDAIQPSHPLSSSSPPALNLSQHQGLFLSVSSSHQVAKVLEFQLQHKSFQ